jgi:hypothetical protein
LLNLFSLPEAGTKVLAVSMGPAWRFQQEKQIYDGAPQS